MKHFYIFIGTISLGLGGFAAFVPLLPSFPFLLLTAILYGKSSDRLSQWFLNSNLYKENLESYVQKKGMTFPAKIRLITVVSLSMFIGGFMLRNYPSDNSFSCLFG